MSPMASQQQLSSIKGAKVLMVFGGIGCELLKTLALSGFEDIHTVMSSLLCLVEFELLAEELLMSDSAIKSLAKEVVYDGVLNIVHGTNPRIFVLLRRCLFDSDDEVRFNVCGRPSFGVFHDVCFRTPRDWIIF
ncbi:SUMO-activating enzyme subunit 2 [Camellia lanceoleosa]|uniref:SUMO-activating enzyme subunit 2 n=1 Tax=Camellia lanceoleosa TaxID=1840588 RepID=A0ACC0I601_9ERIC|nr:SUMO-activating enzyme subunit 2 [Camellia lanceoleosa]